MNGRALAEAARAQEHRVKSENPIRIVIADDHPVFIDGLVLLLETEDDLTVVAESHDGSQVLDALEVHNPDILLLDLVMPGLDGLATLRRMSAVHSKTKIIILTAFDDKNSFEDAMKLGASGIVLKQTATEVLLKAIRTVQAGETWIDAHSTAAVVRERPPQEGRLLSQRQRELVALVAQGFKDKEIAEKMFISERAVKNHLLNVFDKLGVSDRLELAVYAIEQNLHTES